MIDVGFYVMTYGSTSQLEKMLIVYKFFYAGILWYVVQKEHSGPPILFVREREQLRDV